ncbi:hypothetical protein U1Q18_010103, partial [Sarracenia purpurea var. burkii]
MSKSDSVEETVTLSDPEDSIVNKSLPNQVTSVSIDNYACVLPIEGNPDQNGGDGNCGNRIGDCKGDAKGAHEVLDELPKPISWENEQGTTDLSFPLFLGE